MSEMIMGPPSFEQRLALLEQRLGDLENRLLNSERFIYALWQKVFPDDLDPGLDPGDLVGEDPGDQK